MQAHLHKGSAAGPSWIVVSSSKTTSGLWMLSCIMAEGREEWAALLKLGFHAIAAADGRDSERSCLGADSPTKRTGHLWKGCENAQLLRDEAAGPQPRVSRTGRESATKLSSQVLHRLSGHSFPTSAQAVCSRELLRELLRLLLRELRDLGKVTGFCFKALCKPGAPTPLKLSTISSAFSRMYALPSQQISLVGTARPGNSGKPR